MVSGWLSAVVVLGTLAVFTWIGLRATRRDADVEDYVVARNSQSALTLGLSFLAAGMGAWILFAPPEVGAGVGLVGVGGYALGAAAPFVVFGLLGRHVRRVLPAGHSLPEFLAVRFGRGFAAYTAAMSLAYMLIFVMAELTAIGAVAAIVADVSPAAVIVAVTTATLVYTAVGGLRASLWTDRLQAWLLLGLLAAVAVTVLDSRIGAVAQASAPQPPQTPLPVGLEVAVTLVIAVTAANMFHQGYWQRVWAARDDRALGWGAIIGALSTIPVVALVGYLGYIAAARGVDVGSPPAPFFALLAAAPVWLLAPVLVLAVALVASSIDTLETGLASIVVAHRPRTTLTAARWLTVGLMVPAVAVALQGLSVLRLFLIADLLCAATVVPALASLWRRATPAAALSGAVAGLVGAAAGGAVATGSLDGVGLVTMPGAVPTLPPFAGALLASGVVTVAVSLLGRSSVDLERVGAAVPALGEGR